ncbi:hypothetical protein Tco_0980296 [Tanacetum coccineum]
MGIKFNPFAPMDSEKRKSNEKKGMKEIHLQGKDAVKKAKEEFAMEIESLGTKYPIVDWKTHTGCNGSTQTSRRKVCNIKTEDMNLYVWGDLKILFKPDEEDEVWRHQHEYNLISWRLFDSCGIHILLMDNGIAIHVMIEKKNPLTQEMLSKMLSRKLEVHHENEMAFETSKFIGHKTEVEECLE